MTANPRESETIEPIEFGADREAERQRILAAFEAEAPPFTPPTGRLALLAERFGLDPLEADIVGLLWICAVDPALRVEILSQAGYSAQASVLLVARLFGHPARPRLASGSPLLLWRLVQEHELVDGGAALTIDPNILAWLDGVHELDRVLAGHARFLDAGPELESWPIDSVAARLRDGLREGRRWRIRIDSGDALAARWFAAALGRRIGLPVLDVEEGALAGSPDAAIRLHRQAFLTAAFPYSRSRIPRWPARRGLCPIRCRSSTERARRSRTAPTPSTSKYGWSRLDRTNASACGAGSGRKARLGPRAAWPISRFATRPILPTSPPLPRPAPRMRRPPPLGFASA